jgi:hypothetical protein
LIAVQDDSVPIGPGPFTTLNLIGTGVIGTDLGGGVAGATIETENIVFRPGGVQQGNVFTVWADLAAAVAATQGTKVVQFDDSIVTPCVIPGGSWPMPNAIWDGYVRPTFPPAQARPAVVFGDTVNPANDATFPGLRKIIGDLNIQSRNVTTAPIVVPSTGEIFEVGSATGGVALMNIGAAPFFDGRTNIGGGFPGGFGNSIVFRIQATFGTTGNAGFLSTTPMVDIGNTTAVVVPIFFPGSNIGTGAVVGTNAGAAIAPFLQGGATGYAQQNGFAGSIVRLNTPFTRQVMGAPSAIAIAALAINTVQSYTAAVTQPLPLIKSLGLTIGTSPNGSNGTLDTTGMIITIKAGLTGPVTVTPNVADTIDGSTTAVLVQPGEARTFQSNGINNWLVVGAANQEVFGNFVYRPGAVPTSANVFDRWASLMAAKALIGGQKTLQFDSTVVTNSGAGAKSFTQAGAITTLTDAGGLFTPNMVEQSIVLNDFTPTQTSLASAKTITANSPIPGHVTFVDPNAPFTADWVGRLIQIAGATTPANNLFALVVGFVSPTTIIYGNSNAVTEAFPGTWALFGNNAITAAGGAFQITNVISPTQLTYVNPLGATLPMTGTWQIGTTCIIPGGSHDMTETEWTGFRRLGSGPAALTFGTPITGADATFPGLAKIGGDLNTVNANRTLGAVVPTVPGAVFELGAGMTGDAPFLTNLSSAPFFDLRALPAPGAFAVRLNGGFIQGPTPAMAFGAVAAPTLVIINGAVASGMITGGAPGQTLGFFQGATGELDRQNLWLGSITNGTPAANGNNGRGKAIPHMWVFPAAVNQVAPIPAPAVDVIYTTATGLGFNAALITNPSLAPPGPQPLPIIRAAAPPTGSNSVAAGGAPNGTLDSTGSTITFINRGVGVTTLAPAGTDTIDGLAASITIPSGGSRTLMSDGVSNWSVVGAVVGATGDPNTQAYFGPTGVLTDDVDATMTLTDWIQRTSPGGAQAIHVNRAIRSVAIGDSSVAAGLNAFAQGLNAQANGPQSHAEGENSTTAVGAQAGHAEGLSTSVSTQGGHAEGFSTNVFGAGAAGHAEGINTEVDGTAGHSQGQDTRARALAAHASGIAAASTREGQWSHASGQGGFLPTPQVIGASQTSLVTMVGATPGVVANESVELVLGPSSLPLELEDGKDYTFTVTVAVGAVQTGPIRVGRSFIIYFNVRRDAGVSVITATGVGQSFGDPTTSDWTFVASIGAAPDRVALTFTTGGRLSISKVTAEVEFVETAY